MLLIALRGSWQPRRAWAAAVAALGVGVLAGGARDVSPPSAPILGSGYLAAEPVECGDGIGWLSIEAERYAVRSADRVRLSAPPGQLLRPVCQAGALTGATVVADDADVDQDAQGRVVVDRPARRLLAESPGGVSRVLYEGIARWPRLSPDGERVVFSAWRDGSWDLWLADRRLGDARALTRTPANEVEPSWRLSGESVLFASDVRRGLGSTALYRMPIPTRASSAAR
jgi:hypothetical protein